MQSAAQTIYQGKQDSIHPCANECPKFCQHFYHNSLKLFTNLKYSVISGSGSNLATCQLWDLIIYFWLTNWGRLVKHLALDIRGAKLVQEGKWRHVSSKVAATCHSVSLWYRKCDRSCSHNSSNGRLRSNLPQDIRLLQAWGLRT
jgi:hypothetical protein